MSYEQLLRCNVNSVFGTIWNVLLLGVSLAFFGALATVTAHLGQSALELHKRGLISLTALSHSLQTGGGRNYPHPASPH